MGWKEQEIDFVGEPRKVFINFLIFNMKLIEQRLFFDGQVTSAIRPLRGLINSLDEKSQGKLKQQHDKLLSYERDARACSREDMESIYGEVSTYLHATYLKEVGLAHPRYRSSTLEVPKP